MLERVDAIAFIGVDGAVREVDVFANEVDMKLVVGPWSNLGGTKVANLKRQAVQKSALVTSRHSVTYRSRYHFRAGSS